MKAGLPLVALLLLSVCSLGRAELRVSSSVFTVDELEEAKKEAIENRQPLIFVYTDPGTT
jgi:hypothetical protein